MMKKMILRRISCCLLAVCLLIGCDGTSTPSESAAENTNSGLKWYELTDYAEIDFDVNYLGFMNAEGKELH